VVVRRQKVRKKKMFEDIIGIFLNIFLKFKM